tara:strand:+ start:4472 stop:5209 length:738 start_codon:yes stop_codon:yes gene_type:complete
MMRSILMILAVLAVSSTAFANDIYIEQVGDTLDLDITQDGTDNEFGDSTTDATLTGDDMTFSITQTGSTNKIDAIIKGNDYTGTWVFTGDSNEVDMKCASTSAVDCETVTVNITTTGDDNIYKVYVGENSDADNLTANFTVTGDGNVVDVNNDATASDVTVTLNNASSSASGTINNVGSGLTTGSGGNYVDIDQSGAGDSAGHSITLGVVGGGNNVKILQSGVKDNKVDMTMQGDGGDVNISQTD